MNLKNFLQVTKRRLGPGCWGPLSPEAGRPVPLLISLLLPGGEGCHVSGLTLQAEHYSCGEEGQV